MFKSKIKIIYLSITNESLVSCWVFKCLLNNPDVGFDNFDKENGSLRTEKKDVETTICHKELIDCRQTCA